MIKKNIKYDIGQKERKKERTREDGKGQERTRKVGTEKNYKG